MVTPGGSTNLPPQGIVAPDGGMPIDPNTGAPVSMDLGAVSFDPNTGQGGNIEDELLRRFQMQQGWNY